MSRLLLIPILLAATAPAMAEEPPAPTAPPAELSFDASGDSGGSSVQLHLGPLSISASMEPFIPDVYPHSADAARGLGELWAKRASETWSKPPVSLRIYCCDAALYATVAEGIRSRLPNLRIEKAPADQCPDGFNLGRPVEQGVVWALVSSDGSAVTIGDGGEEDKARRKTELGGKFSLIAKGATDVAATTDWVEKEWVGNFAAFIQRNPGRRWIVGRSDPLKPAMSEAEAARAARVSAAGDLFGLVRAWVPSHGRSGANDEWVARHLEQALVGGRLVSDQFPQKYERPIAGTTWREAVLLDASDPAIQQLAGELAAARAAENQSWLMSVASAGGVLLVTYALYRLANAFTRGYFVWSLRTAAAVVATAAVVLLLMVIG